MSAANRAAAGSRPLRAPRECPVCDDQLTVTRLGCTSCGSELGGQFASCDFCSLPAEDLQLLRVFLASRGNMREVEKHLQVSYPTARARFARLLEAVGISATPDATWAETAATKPESAPDSDLDAVLAKVVSGELSPEDAARELG